MGWEDLIAPQGGTDKVLPWTGGRQVFSEGRTWNIRGKLPDLPGWYTFDTSGGRVAWLRGGAEADLDYDQGRSTRRGYLVGNRLIPDGSTVVRDPHKMINQTIEVHLAEMGLGRFARAVVAEREDGQFIYIRQEFPAGPEGAVEMAYQDRKDSLDGIKDVTPGLDLAFRWLSHQRHLIEERRRDLEQQRAEELAQQQKTARMQLLRENLGRPDVRREIAAEDFELAAKAALALTNSVLLDTRPGYGAGEMVVTYRVRARRMECIVDARTLRIVDAGMCLEDHRTGERGDTRFTLESLPSVVEESMDLGALHEWEVGRM